jgi:MFS family permease
MPDRDATRRLFAFLNFGHALDHLFMLIFPTVVLALSVEFGRSYGELLPLALGGFIAFGICSLPAGWLGDRWSRYRMMLVFFFGIGTASILAGLSQGEGQLALALTLIGVFAAIYHPVANAMLVADPARIGRTLGLNGLFGNLGLGFAALIAGALTDLVGWRAAFIVPGAISILGGAGFWLMVPDPGPVAKTPGRGSLAVDRTLMLRFFAVLMVATLCGGVIFSATTIAMPKVFDERLAAITTTTFGIGALVCVVYTLAAFAQLCVRPLIDRLDMKSVFVPVVALQVPLLFLAGLADGWVMMLAAVLMMFFVFGQIPINDAMVARYTADEFRSRVYALRYLVSFGASAIAVPLVAFLHDRFGGFQQIFAVLAALALGTFAAALAFPDRRRIRAGTRAIPAE